MDKSGEIRKEQRVIGVAPGAGQMAYSSHYKTDPLVASGTPSVAVPTPAQPPAAFSNSINQLACLQAQPPAGFSNSVDQLAYLQAQHFPHQQEQQQDFHDQLLQKQQDFDRQLWKQQNFHYKLQKQKDFHHKLQQLLKEFWEKQMQEIDQTPDFKNLSLPVRRIKRIMKMDEDVRMISLEAPVLFVKACELFTLDLTLRSLIHAEENKRNTLQKKDVEVAIASNIVFDFLVDIDPKDELKEEEGSGIAQFTIPIEEGHGSAESTIPIANRIGIAQSTIPIAKRIGIPQSTIPMEEEPGFAHSTIQTEENLGIAQSTILIEEELGIASNDANDFLDDLIQMDELKEKKGLGFAQANIPIQEELEFAMSTISIKEELGVAQPTIPMEERLGFAQSNTPIAQSTIPIMGHAADLPYYNVPPQHPVGPTGMIMGNPVDQAALFSNQQPQPSVAFMPWPNAYPQPPQQQQQTDSQ